jgi:hypothetical protein
MTTATFAVPQHRARRPASAAGRPSSKWRSTSRPPGKARGYADDECSLRLREPGPRQSNNDPSDSGHGDIGREYKCHDNSPAWAPSPGWAPSNDGVIDVCAGSVIDAKHALTALSYSARYPERRIEICAKLLTLEAVATEGTRMSPIRAESTTRKRFALQLCCEVCDFIQTGVVNGPILPRRSEGRGVMYDAQRYRRYAADCLRAAFREGQPYSRVRRVSMAASWLSLAHQDEAMDELL